MLLVLHFVVASNNFQFLISRLIRLSRSEIKDNYGSESYLSVSLYPEDTDCLSLDKEGEKQE